MNTGATIVCIEGMDTAGKSTQTDKLKNRLEDEGLKVAVIHFPRYEKPIGALIGEALKNNITVSRSALQMMYVADFTDFQSELLSLSMKNDVIILDRYFFSTFVFAQAAGISFDEVFDWTKRLVLPHITYILDLPPEEISRRKKELDKHESDYLLMRKVRQNYKKLGYQFKEKGVEVPMVFVNAKRDANTLNNIIFKEVTRRWQVSRM